MENDKLGFQNLNNSVPVINPITPPTPPPPPFVSQQSLAPKPKSNIILYSALAVILLLVLASSYFVVKKLDLFAPKAALTEQTFLTGIFQKIGDIKSSSYLATFYMGVGPRDKDAKPFTTTITNTNDLRQKYQNDSKRASDVMNIISNLKYSTKLPATIDGVNTNTTTGYYGVKPSIADPKTKEKYKYRLIDNGKDFELVVDFETDNAIKTLRSYLDSASKGTAYNYGGSTYSATSTVINGNTVTFRKNGLSYFYLSSEPPQPLLVQMSESLKMLPKDVNASFSFGASSKHKDDQTDWLFNFDAKGDFGDLTYRVNMDASKVGKDYYFKINNIPSLLGDLSSLKGQWVKISSNYLNSSTTNVYGGSASYMASQFPEYEKEYQKNRESSQKLLKLAVEVAKDTNLIKFRSSPTKDKIDDVNLTKYDVQFRKESVLTFYKQLTERVKNDSGLSSYYTNIVDDQGMVEYLESKEFSEFFDYFDKNTSLVIWVDSQGFVEKVQEKIRVVPPDTAEQLKDSQINFVFDLVLSKINENNDISAPKEYKPIEDIIKSTVNNMNSSSAKSKLAALKANLSSVRVDAEIAYDKANSYGSKSFKLGPCKNTAGTLFADTNIFNDIKRATSDKPETALCSSDTKSWAVSLTYPDDKKYSWCVDSSGSSLQIEGSIKGNSCN